MKRLLLITALLSLPLLPLGSAQAGDWIVGGNLGMARGDSSASELDNQLAAQGLDASASSADDNRGAWQLYAAYDYTPRWGVALGYVDLGKVTTRFSGTTAGIDTFLASSSDIHPQTAQGWQLAGRFRYPLDEHSALRAQLGAFAWKSDYTLATASASRRVTRSGTSASAALGVEHTVWRHTALHLDYARYAIDGEPVAVLSLGMSYRFD